MNKNLKKVLRKLKSGNTGTEPMSAETNPVNFDKAMAIIDKNKPKTMLDTLDEIDQIVAEGESVS